eukprot:jgi/Botrbrau1/22144/Bobra.0206s0068.1
MKGSFNSQAVLLFAFLATGLTAGSGNSVVYLEHWEYYKSSSFPTDYGSLGAPSSTAYLPTISSYSHCSDRNDIQCAFCQFNGAATYYVNRYTGFVALTTASYRFSIRVR